MNPIIQREKAVRAFKEQRALDEALKRASADATPDKGETPGVAAVAAGSRPCPFCGDTRRPDIEETKDREGSLFHAECQCCGAQGPLATTRGAAQICWDERRAPGDTKQFCELSDRLAGANKKGQP